MAEDTEALLRRELISNAGIQLGNVVVKTDKSIQSQKQQAEKIIDMIYSLNQSVDTIHESTTHIDQTSSTLESLSKNSVDSITTVSEQMHTLEQSFEPIFKSIDLINTITDSTKLLAVNATIQAAKAGVAGQSFAVVAKEIQELSTSTQKTSLSITEQMDALKKSMQSLNQSLGVTVESLNEMKTGAESNKAQVNQIIDETIALSQNMSETHTRSLQVKDTTHDLLASSSEVTTINATFDAILQLMKEKNILNERHDAVSLFEELAETSDFLDSNRFAHHEEEYVLKDSDILISQTDTKGIITYGNRTFYRVAEFEKDEMDGKPHNIIRHPDMPKAAFKHLWDTIQSGNIWQGIVLNRGKKGKVYWVRATVFPVYKNGKIVGYLSIRNKPSSQEISRAQKTYQRLP